ncbi:MAG TPA: NUDIX domain-containing protein [Tepidisphaeraceae bacterium]|nr:NUDIX domain-containing protein [Tepidisphaeraceae bacterium]
MRLYVCSFAFPPGRDRVLLIRKNRPAWQAGKLNGVGGKIEPGETPRQAARREFEEETGLALPEAVFEHVLTLSGPDDISVPDRPGPIGWQGHFFRVICDVNAARSVTDEALEIHSAGALPDSVIPNLRWIIPMMLDEWLAAGEYEVEVKGR